MRTYCFLMFVIILAVACEEDCATAEKDCIEKVLQNMGMVRYENQEMACRDFLELYDFNGKQYFLLGNHCADMIFNPFDCNDTKICEDSNSSDCREFSEKAKSIGIIGIKIE